MQNTCVCFSGTLSSSRSMMEENANKAGIGTASGVRGRVTHLVSTAGEVLGQTSKVREAIKKNVPIVGEEWFEQTVAAGAPVDFKAHLLSPHNGSGGGGAGGGGGGGGGGKAPISTVPASATTPADHEAINDASHVMLAEKWDRGDGKAKQDVTGWWMSEKLDGMRCYWSGTNFYTRNGNLVAAPDYFKVGLPKDQPLDGELWCGRGQFQQLISITRSSAKSDGWKFVVFAVFDAPKLKDPSTGTPAAFEYRLDWLKANLAQANTGAKTFAQAIGFKRIVSNAEAEKELDDTLKDGGEGLMFRAPRSLYQWRRDKSLLKAKRFFDEEGIVVDNTVKGSGKNSTKMGSILLETPDGRKVKVGSGFTDLQRVNPPAIGAVCTYKFQELTNSLQPRFPTFICERHDLDWAVYCAGYEKPAKNARSKMKKKNKVMFSSQALGLDTQEMDALGDDDDDNNDDDDDPAAAAIDDDDDDDDDDESDEDTVMNDQVKSAVIHDSQMSAHYRVQLVSEIDPAFSIDLNDGCFTLGRDSQPGLSDQRMSRKHICITTDIETGLVAAKCIGQNKSLFKRAASDSGTAAVPGPGLGSGAGSKTEISGFQKFEEGDEVDLVDGDLVSLIPLTAGKCDPSDKLLFKLVVTAPGAGAAAAAAAPAPPCPAPASFGGGGGGGKKRGVSDMSGSVASGAGAGKKNASKTAAAAASAAAGGGSGGGASGATDNKVVAEHLSFGSQVIMAVKDDLLAAPFGASCALVNSSNPQLQHKHGLAGAIAKKAGAAMQTECDAIMAARGGQDLAVGENVITSAGNLEAAHVIHMLVPSASGPGTNTLADCITGALETAHANGLSGIAFPAVGTGAAGYANDVCADALVGAASRFCKAKADNSLGQIVFVSNSDAIIECFKGAFRKHFGGLRT